MIWRLLKIRVLFSFLLKFVSNIIPCWIIYGCLVLIWLAHWPSGQSVCQWSGRPGFNHRSRHTKDFKKKKKKRYLIPPCLTLSNTRYVSRVKWSNPGKGVAPSPTPRCSSYWKGSLPVALDYSCQLTYLWWKIYKILNWY